MPLRGSRFDRPHQRIDAREHVGKRRQSRKALSAMATGDVLVVECTDPLAAIDIPNLINQTGDTLEETLRADKVITFRIRKR